MVRLIMRVRSTEKNPKKSIKPLLQTGGVKTHIQLTGVPPQVFHKKKSKKDQISN